MKYVIWLMALFLFVGVSVKAQASTVPELVNYQGNLTNSNGDTLPTGEYKLSFKIYTVTSFGTPVWGPQTFSGIPVVRGQINVILGVDDGGKSITEAFKSEEAYLEIAVNDATPISPRQKILSTPYAIRSRNGVPVGTIISSMLNETQFAKASGDDVVTDKKKRVWIPADGKIDVTGSQYASITGKNTVPDLQGMFLRGVSTGRTVGSKQEDTTRLPRALGFSGATSANGVHSHSVQGARSFGAGAGAHERATPQTFTTSSNGNHAHSVSITSGGDSETRPVNIAVYYYIRIN